ncbi:MAG: SAM-dependent methyltransferase [Desulfuromonas sp.]|nr:MAG: SAM-dependent methyltransferase [Desulfuromonas sp.]
MPFILDSVVPWGRSFDEYIAMFLLSDKDLQTRILGCSDGPASFNAELHQRGGTALSVDPLYNFSPAAISGRIDATCATILAQLEANRDAYHWERFGSPAQLGKERMATMQRFLADLPQGRAEGRYLPAALPQLPLATGSFDLALCSHFLFLYSDHVDLNFHLQAVDELCRVASEVRIFPLVTLADTPSPHLEPLRHHLDQSGLMHSIETSNYHFQSGGDQMLRILSPD